MPTVWAASMTPQRLGALGLRRFPVRALLLVAGAVVLALIVSAALEPVLHAGREQGLEPEEWRRIVATNLDSVFHMCRLAVPHMREKRFGRIVNFAAVGAAATLGEPQMAAYSAAKAGVVALSRALALEEARCGITVNVVSPGLLKDESGSRAAAAADAMLGDRVPVGHPGRAADVVRAVFF